MKRIGLLGGMSWESSAHYYTLINELVAARLGGLHSADCVMASVDFAEIERMQVEGRWDDAGAYLAKRASELEKAGADFLVICTNTMHKVADEIGAAISIPLLHLGDATASAVRAAGLSNVGLLGTRFTMDETFYVDRLASHDLSVLLPDPDQRRAINDIIYGELVLGIIRPQSRATYLEIIDSLRAQGADGVILGCTEIELLVTQDDTDLPLFATTAIHAEAAVDLALT